MVINKGWGLIIRLRMLLFIRLEKRAGCEKKMVEVRPAKTKESASEPLIYA